MATIVAVYALAVNAIMCLAFGASIDAFLSVTGMIFAAIVITLRVCGSARPATARRAGKCYEDHVH